MKKRLIIHHNIGLGDHLICNGLVNHLSEKQKIYLICSLRNYESVKYLYSENNFVTVIPVPSLNILNNLIKLLIYKKGINFEKIFSKVFSFLIFSKIKYIGFEEIKFPDWDRSFYDLANLSFHIRYEKLSLPTQLPKKPRNINLEENFILVQDTSSKRKERFNLNIKSKEKKIYLNKSQTSNFFSNIYLIKNAKEIHSIDSSLVHLVEAVNGLDTKLYFHDIRKHYGDAVFSAKKDWTVVKYDKLISWGSGIKLI
tara:strand:- start:156 stop:920 length:765 start_codon:yes stop_codon:yes gene_type:complete